jgi:hypothetical protein
MSGNTRTHRAADRRRPEAGRLCRWRSASPKGTRSHSATIADRAVELINLRVSASDRRLIFLADARRVCRQPPAPVVTRVVLHPAVTVPTAWPVYRFDALFRRSFQPGDRRVSARLQVPPG